MIDLRPVCGLPLTLDEADPALPLRFSGGLQPGHRIERSLVELRRSLADPQAAGPDPAYWMYNGVACVSAADAQGAYHWRYDLTVLPPGRVGDEYLRTVGHYHPLLPGREEAWPEVYEVVHGAALFVLQRVADHWAPPEAVRVEELILLRAEAGEKALLPPNYGHWTVNVTEGPLVISNWICADFESDYAPVLATRGPVCHLLVGPNGPCYVANPGYAHPPWELKHARTVEAPELGLEPGRPIFDALAHQPEVWRWVCDPALAATDVRSAMRITRADPFPR